MPAETTNTVTEYREQAVEGERGLLVAMLVMVILGVAGIFVVVLTSRRPPGAPVGRRRRRLDGAVRAGRPLPAGVRQALGRDHAEPAGLVVLERLDQLVAGVHHERAVVRHRLADRLAAHDVQLQRRGVARPAARRR